MDKVHIAYQFNLHFERHKINILILNDIHRVRTNYKEQVVHIVANRHAANLLLETMI